MAKMGVKDLRFALCILAGKQHEKQTCDEQVETPAGVVVVDSADILCVDYKSRKREVKDNSIMYEVHHIQLTTGTK